MEPLIKTRWEEILSSPSAKHCFEHKGNNILWDPPLAAVDTALEILLDSSIKGPYKSHVMLVPRLMKLSLRKQMGKEANLLSTVTIRGSTPRF